MNGQTPVPSPKLRWFLKALLVAEVILSAAALLILAIVLIGAFEENCGRAGARILEFWRGFGEGAGLKNPETSG